MQLIYTMFREKVKVITLTRVTGSITSCVAVLLLLLL